MGRHADPTPRRRAVPVLLAVGVVLLLVTGGLLWERAGTGGCAESVTVDVTVAPELGELTDDVLAELDPPGGDLCVTADVTVQEPVSTAETLGALAAEELPDVWVPDSSLWLARSGLTDELERVGSMALSPVVLATSRTAVDALGWTGAPPTWGEVLGSGRALAVPDLAAGAAALSALAAVHSSLGGDADADDAVVAAALAAARRDGPAPADALAAGSQGSADAPLVPVSEQTVLAANADAAADAAGGPELVAVYPAEGSPVLDHPVVRVGSPSGARERAVDVVVDALLSERARTAVGAVGFRGPEGSAPAGAGARSGTAEAMPETLPLDGAEVRELLTRLPGLSAPSRVLAVVDVSTSMGTPVGDGTRATLARDAAQSTLARLPDDAAMGLWAFAAELEGEQEWTELVPPRELDAVVDGTSQRQLLDDQLDTLPDRLAPGGTGLYDTTLAAVRAVREGHDPAAVNSVVVVTDGTNEDDAAGITLGNLVITLAAEADPERPVEVIGVALGPDADLPALERISDVTGGTAYSAVDEDDLRTVLSDALRRPR